MEISDQIIVINDGRVEQAGTPNELYDHPANDFVMGFLGPVTRLGTRLVRPHDIEVAYVAGADSHPAVINRLVSLGFETRVVAHPVGGGEPITVQLTRKQIHDLGLKAGDNVHLSTYPAGSALSSLNTPREPVTQAG
jgi:sulfate transport system ATP-binding protein